MPNELNNQKMKTFDIKDSLANERTFLSWVSTSIGIMAFGFVIEKFSIFLKQLTYFFDASNTAQVKLPPPGLQSYSSITGIVLVAFGTIICLLAFINYKKIDKQIRENNYKTTLPLDYLLTFSILITGIFLVIYLIVGIH